MRALPFLIILPSMALITPALLAAPVTVHEAATPFAWPTSAPLPSDVTIRSLKFRPVSADDPQDTFKALEAFHATRLEWVYLTHTEDEKEKVQRVKDMGRVFGGASNSSSGTYVRWNPDGSSVKKHTIVDLNGEPVIHGHMVKWERPQSPGCVNNPEYIKGHAKYLKSYVDAGVDAMQRDEPSTSHSWARMDTGCFCGYCIKGFRDFLRKTLSPKKIVELKIDDLDTFDYADYVRKLGGGGKRKAFDWSNPSSMKSLTKGDSLSQLFIDFQESSTATFFKIMKDEMSKHAGKDILYSSNNTSFQRWDEPYFMTFDFCMSELMMKSANPVHLFDRAQKARSLGKVQVFGTPKIMGKKVDPKELTELKRRVIATTYSVGALSRVPWDIFQQTSDGKGRYFGKPEDYADLYGFVRANHRYLHNYCTAGAIGKGIHDNRYGKVQPVRVVEGGQELYAFLRADPSRPSSPVVIHLVDWDQKKSSGSLKLQLHVASFFPEQSISVTRRQPRSYNPSEHQKASSDAQKMRSNGASLGPLQSAAYESLVDSNQVKASIMNGIATVELPRPEPWCMLVISPDTPAR